MSIKSFSRRSLLSSLGVAGALVTTKSLANICGMATAEQPLGPFFPRPGTPTDPIQEDKDQPIYLANDNDLTVIKGRHGVAKGQIVNLRGQLTNENCEPIANATIIIWQASASGRYNHQGDNVNQDFRHPKTGEMIQRSHDPSFQYWGKATTDENGNYTFKTVVPGFYPADLNNGWYRPPHIHFMISATGYPQLVTQMYFRGQHIEQNEYFQELNEKDFLLQNPDLTEEEREELIVDFYRDFNGDLNGTFSISLKR